MATAKLQVSLSRLLSSVVCLNHPDYVCSVADDIVSDPRRINCFTFSRDSNEFLVKSLYIDHKKIKHVYCNLNK